MSDTKPGGMDMPNSGVEASAASWLRRQQYFDWSDTEQAQFDVWMAQSDNHAAAYWRLKAAWARTERLAALRSPVSSPTVAADRNRSWHVAGRSVVGLSLLLIIGVAAMILWQPGSKTYSTPVGGRETVVLADGSSIDLNTNTVLRAYLGHGRRTIEVEHGEAYFRVKHDTSSPFIVIAAKHRIVDIGTTFLVRTSANKLEVALISGRARLETSGIATRQVSKVLTPGDVAVATSDSLNVSKKLSNELTDKLAWRRGALVFHNTNLADAADQFNRYSGTKLIVPDTQAAALTINGTFRTDGVEQFARATSDVFGLRVEHRGSDIVIGR
jgi:transmembrane sensor